MMLYYTALIFLPFLLILGIIGFTKRKNYDTTHSIIFYYIIFGFINEIVLRLCAIIFKNNILVYNLSSLLEFFIFFYFFYSYINKNVGKFVYSLILGIFLATYFIELADKGFFSMPTYSPLCKNVLLIILGIIAFRKITTQVETPLITDYPIFWINSSILIYFSCTLFIFGLRKYTLHLPNLTLVSIYLHLFFAFVFYSLLSIGLWKTSKK